MKTPPITYLDEAVGYMRKAAQEMDRYKLPRQLILNLLAQTDELLGFIEDLPNETAERTFEDGIHCRECKYLMVDNQKLPCGDRVIMRADVECTAPGASDCPVVKTLFGKDS